MVVELSKEVLSSVRTVAQLYQQSRRKFETCSECDDAYKLLLTSLRNDDHQMVVDCTLKLLCFECIKPVEISATILTNKDFGDHFSVMRDFSTTINEIGRYATPEWIAKMNRFWLELDMAF